MGSHLSKEPGYSFHLVNIDCLRSSTDFNVVMDLEEPIEDLLPYLAAALPGSSFVPGTGVINLVSAGHIIGIYASQITITLVAGPEEGARLCGEYFTKIRDVRNRKEEITPVRERRPGLTLMDILRALPKTNCGSCEEATCTAFAAKVFRREAPLSACPAFTENRSRHEALLAKMAANGYEVA
ncbi:MAG: (Fe-S)-binding protein [bacterium]